MSGTANDHIRFVVAKAGVPVDRMRMNLAHECGHIVINPTEDASFEEAAAYRFAAALLIPDAAVYERIGRARNNIDMRELLMLKQEYGISIQALVRRCHDLNVISDWTYRQLNIQLRALGRHRHEPGDCHQIEEPSVLRSRFLRSLTEGLVSEKEVASMFPTVMSHFERLESDSLWRWSELRNAPRAERDKILKDAFQSASKEYAENGSLSGFDIMDDIDEEP